MIDALIATLPAYFALKLAMRFARHLLRAR